MTSNDHKLSPITGELIMGLDMYLSAEKYIYENATEVKNVLAKIGFDTNKKVCFKSHNMLSMFNKK
jgi:hypothetical protein